jgi:hypothetical protein
MGLSGDILLDPSLSGFEPQRKSSARYGAIWNGVAKLNQAYPFVALARIVPIR